MFRAATLCLAVLFFFFIPFTFADDGSWQNLGQISQGQKIQVVQMDLNSHEGTFSGYDEQSIQLMQGSKVITARQDNVLRVSLRGPSKRKRNVLLGLAVGAGAGLGIGLVASRTDDDEGFDFISDDAITAGLVVTGAGAGSLMGAIWPAHDYRVIYRVQPKFKP